MARVFRSDQSDADLFEIGVYIARDSLRAAERFIDRIERSCDRLAEHPGMGYPRPDLGPALRGCNVGSYLIVYRPIEDGIELVRIVHGARAIGRMFGGE